MVWHSDSSTPKMNNYHLVQPQSQARITSFLSDEDAGSDDETEKNSGLSQPDWMRTGSDDEGHITRRPPLPIADDVLSSGLNTTLVHSCNPPTPDQPQRQLRNRRRLASSTTVAPEPAVEAKNTWSTIPTLTSHTGQIPTQQFTRGTQIMQYKFGKEEYEWRTSSSAEFIEVLQETDWGERLITTPYLKSFGLSFNTAYQLIICTPCAEGLPISFVHTHLTNTDASRSNMNSSGKWKASSVAYDSVHPLPTSKVPTDKQLRREILETLQAAGFTVRDAGIDANNAAGPTPAWKLLPLPDTPTSACGLHCQVLGLRVFASVLKCMVCGLIRTNAGGMSTHMSEQHRGFPSKANSRLVHAQTLAEVRSWMVYFEVSEVPSVLVSERRLGLDNGDLDRPATLALLRKKKATALRGIEVVPDKEVRTIPPVFVRTGIDQYLSPFNRKVLYETFALVDRTDLDYLQLRHILLPMFSQSVDLMKTAPSHHTIYSSITNCTP